MNSTVFKAYIRGEGFAPVLDINLEDKIILLHKPSEHREDALIWIELKYITRIIPV